MNDKIRTTIYLPKEIHEKMRELAFYSRKSISKIIEEQCEITLEKNKKIISNKPELIKL